MIPFFHKAGRWVVIGHLKRLRIKKGDGACFRVQVSL